MPQYNPSWGGSITRALSRLSPVVGGERRWVEKIVAAAERRNMTETQVQEERLLPIKVVDQPFLALDANLSNHLY